ncbi:Diaminohydroxyphosphoribosylamino-pyrimidine deaminase [Grifola frondosa]|uniref:Diaminohydroxyphosphoribosylamino-pyrimidine deaminase n=1 Tax=Grifola frondosa TaxID=5627 RepID=A0A1C7LR44_GRIFR|nr:Diaminohydroxyphosphoribosylamino-pyrimidine deaminase [Grifola frondosa]
MEDQGIGQSPIMRGPVQIPPGSTLVSDADEEVFLLYTALAARKSEDGTTSFRGLGHVDSHEDTLSFTFTLGTPITSGGDKVETVKNATSKASKKKRNTRLFEVQHVLEVEIMQDKTALRSRKGDTGSVVWRASVDFAQTVLQQHYSRSPNALLNPSMLSNSHVLELGAGTGLLSIVLSPLVQHYTVTDIDALVPLIQKNLTRNLPKFPALSPSRRAHPLDWMTLHNASASFRRTLVPFAAVDLLLVVDCIYHPSLLPALLSTINYLTVPEKTSVVVVVELRAEDVIRDFLQGWLDLSDDGIWEIWSVSGFLEGPYAVWVGWKKSRV